jgi:hypothetical protein
MKQEPLIQMKIDIKMQNIPDGTYLGLIHSQELINSPPQLRHGP